MYVETEAETEAILVREHVCALETLELEGVEVVREGVELEFDREVTGFGCIRLFCHCRCNRCYESDRCKQYFFHNGCEIKYWKIKLEVLLSSIPFVTRRENGIKRNSEEKMRNLPYVCLTLRAVAAKFGLSRKPAALDFSDPTVTKTAAK